ncbi:lytic transglycosylase [Salipiger sp. 1_MG-2023]|uniref:transglycosylase SLT domain-containing protein n=1 Tax=Salipiger sp. 1_MG-2023 TaxID=3062665 RepID=UPI0026E3CBC1|nr:lytic transglycosylase [Salipiger sp. 1_MG-2023]MDO6586166.1 lytic transglycosylase [Salipiger sp. 1_MG-2023]
MSRWLRALVLVLLAASCGGGGGNGTAPRDLENACAILNERPHYARAFRAAERKWGVPVHVQMATIYQESKFISDARTPFRYALGVIPYGRQSSAFGYSQALDGTWDEYLEDTGQRRARRDDIRDAVDFMGWYMSGTNASLGISKYDARNQYLAYHEGRTGYKRGTYNSKAWLVRVADDVGKRALVYQVQLATCRAAR